MKKLQVPLTIVVLLLVVLGMNTVADMRQKQAQARAKEVEKTRQAAENAASVAKAEAEGRTGEKTGHGAKPAFKLPANSGPATAPVKLEVFVNDANSCHESSTSLKALQDIYGQKLRIEWLSMNEPKNSARSDKLAIGCEAGLVINGKIEVQMDKNGGKVLTAFRGPVGDKYKLSDVYRAINMALTQKGAAPPAAALKNAEL